MHVQDARSLSEPCKDVFAMPDIPKSNCTIAVVQLAPLKSVPTQTQYPMPAMPVKEQFAPYCCAAASPFEVYPETAAHNRTTVVFARNADFAAFIITGGQGWTAAFVSFKIVII